MHFRKLLATAGALVSLAGAPGCGGPPQQSFDSAQGKLPDPAHDPRGTWQKAPEYLPLFAPAHAHTGSYEAFVSPLGLPTLLRQMERDQSLLRPPGAWQPVALLPSDAFGQTGSYDRWKMAKLYGAGRAMVARGPHSSFGDRPTEAWTLISPYPNTNLDRLEPGTLLIVLDLVTR